MTESYAGEVIKLHQNGSFVKSVRLYSPNGISSSTNEIFVSYNDDSIFKYDLDLNAITFISGCVITGLIAQPCLSGIRGLYFDFNSSLLYAVDKDNLGIHVFNSSLFRIDYTHEIPYWPLSIASMNHELFVGLGSNGLTILVDWISLTKYLLTIKNKFLG